MPRLLPSAIAALAMLASLAGCAAPAPRGPVGRAPVGMLRANPSEVIATELAFARAAQEQGQWTAFQQYSTPQAVMFVPQAVNAHAWLKDRANPSQSVAWKPHQVWSSCDGSTAVTRGAWQRPDGSHGYFITVWELQADGAYKWVLDQGEVLAEPLPEPDMIAAEVADCQPKLSPPPVVRVPLPTDPSGSSLDGTLKWVVLTEADGSRTVSVQYWADARWAPAILERVQAE